MHLDFEQPAPKPEMLKECRLVIAVLWQFFRALQEVAKLKQEVILLCKATRS